MPTVTGIATSFIDFTRASNATVTDSDGKVKWAPHNLLTNSESFDNAAWGKYLATVSANTQAAPNGTTTADTVTASAGNDVHRVQRASDVAIGASANASLSIFVKAGTHNFVTIGFYSATEVFVSATFNLASGSAATETDVGTTSGTVVSTEKVDVGTGWYRLTITGNYSGSTALSFVNFAQAATGNSYTNFGQPVANLVGTETFHLWGASLYRSDLGGMQPNTSAYPMYNPTTPKNLLGWTEALSNAAWVVLNGGASAPTKGTTSGTKPNGLTGTIDTLTIPAVAASQWSALYQNAGAAFANVPITFSVYARVASGSATIYLNVEDIGAGPSGGNFIASTAKTLDTTWQRISVTGTRTTTVGNSIVVIGFDTRCGAGQTNASPITVELWGAQLSDSASLDTYVPVYGAAVTSAAYYGPRRDFDGATLACKGLLVEEQRVNLVLNSAAFDQTSWTKTSQNSATTPTITVDAGVSPSGDNTADRAQFSRTGTASTDRSRIDTSSITVDINSDYTFSVWMKSYGGSNQTVTLLPNYGTGAAVAVTVTSTWQRFSITANTSAGTTAVVNIGLGYVTNSVTSADVLIWGAQFEKGSFATSYIPTGAATATRNADVASVSTQAFPYSATEGSIVVNASSPCIAAIANMITLDNGTTQERIRLLTDVASVKTIVTQSNTTQANLSPGSATANTPFKFSVAYKVNDFAAVVNGSAAATYPTGNVPVVNIARLGADSSGNYLNGHIRQITYLPRRISNAELVTRST